MIKVSSEQREREGGVCRTSEGSGWSALVAAGVSAGIVAGLGSSAGVAAAGSSALAAGSAAFTSTPVGRPMSCRTWNKTGSFRSNSKNN